MIGGVGWWSLGVKGAKIFNLLPVWIRTMSGISVDKFKSELDKFLAVVPDSQQYQDEAGLLVLIAC